MTNPQNYEQKTWLTFQAIKFWARYEDTINLGQEAKGKY